MRSRGCRLDQLPKFLCSLKSPVVVRIACQQSSCICHISSLLLSWLVVWTWSSSPDPLWCSTQLGYACRLPAQFDLGVPRKGSWVWPCRGVVLLGELSVLCDICWGVSVLWAFLLLRSYDNILCLNGSLGTAARPRTQCFQIWQACSGEMWCNCGQWCLTEYFWWGILWDTSKGWGKDSSGMYPLEFVLPLPCAWNTVVMLQVMQPSSNYEPKTHGRNVWKEGKMLPGAWCHCEALMAFLDIIPYEKNKTLICLRHLFTCFCVSHFFLIGHIKICGLYLKW